MAELPLTVQLVSVAVPSSDVQAAAGIGGGVAADGAVGQRGRAAVVVQAAAVAAGGVAADGAVGQRGRAVLGVMPGRRRRSVAELPLTVQLVSVVVPP